MNLPELTAIIMAVIALGGMFIQWRNGRSQAAKNLAEAGEAEADTEVKLLPAYKEEVKSLREDLRLANERIDILKARLDTMGAELRLRHESASEYRVIAEKLTEQLKLHDIKPIVNLPDWIG